MLTEDMDDMLRVGDRDREEVAAALREHYAQGRLSLEEFDERSTAAYAAKTVGELRRLTADLPVASGPATPTARSRAWSPTTMRWILVVAIISAVLIAMALVTGRALLFCPPWLIALIVIRGLRGRGACSSAAGRRASRRIGGSASVLHDAGHR